MIGAVTAVADYCRCVCTHAYIAYLGDYRPSVGTYLSKPARSATTMSVKTVPAATAERARVQATIVDLREGRRGREKKEGEREEGLHRRNEEEA